MMGWYGGGMTGFAWMGMGLFWLALLGLIVWLVMRLLPGKSRASNQATVSTTLPNSSAGTSPSAPALAILDERLAKGEVDMEAYRAIRATLVESRQGER